MSEKVLAPRRIEIQAWFSCGCQEKLTKIIGKKAQKLNYAQILLVNIEIFQKSKQIQSKAA